MNVRNASFVFYFLSGIIALANSMIFVAFAVYLVTVVGLNPLQLVLVGTTLELGYGLLQIPTGIIADTYSRRLAVIIGVFIMGTAFICEGLFPFFVAMLVGEAVRGIGDAFADGATHAWLADEVGEAHVGPIMLRNGQVCRITGFIGLGGAAVLGSLGLQLPFIVGGALYLVLGVVLVVIMPEHGFTPLPRTQGGALRNMGRTVRESVGAVRNHPTLLTIVSISFFVGAASEGFDRLWEAHIITNIGFPRIGDLQPVAWFALISVVSDILSIVLVEGLRKRLKTTDSVSIARALLIFGSISITSIIILALAANFAIAAAALLVKGMIGGLVGPLYDTWLIQNTDAKGRATILSMMGQSNAFGQIAGGPGVGLIGTIFSLRAALAIAGLLLSPTLALYARVVRRGTPAPLVPDEEIADLEPIATPLP